MNRGALRVAFVFASVVVFVGACVFFVACERETPPISKEIPGEAEVIRGGARPSRYPNEEPGPPTLPTPVEVVRHTYYPREGSEDYWEVVSREKTGARFLLVIHPRIKAPIEGPWLVEFRDPSGAVLSRHEGLRVDVATGNFTFLCHSDGFAPGDWGLRMTLEDGGVTAGERVREYRFRVE
jgi:hypothetical protein